MAPKTAVAIRHVHFEDLGAFEAILEGAGYGVRYHDGGVESFQAVDPIGTDLVIILGGPVGVYETEAYPFLIEEGEFVKARLSAKRPTLGICLGAQLIAAAMGANVAPSGIKEIGFSALTLTEAGRRSPLRHLDGVPVLHWHGDMFDIPAGAAYLAATEVCRHQAFTHGANIMGLQFHPEIALDSGIERWLIGHAVELAAAKGDPRALRRDYEQCGPLLQEAARKMFAEWLDGLKA